MPPFEPVPSKPDHIALEHRALERWERERTFEVLRDANRGNERWSFIDGPITANNAMGVHHGWGRTIKDIWQRYHAMLGHDQRYQNGFDCQGLWVEVGVEKELGLNSKPEIEEYGLERFAIACRERVATYAGQLTEHSKRLGQWMDWDKSYYTMTDPNISDIWKFLKRCHDLGWLYKGHKSMPWCPRCGTSLSQHELIDSYQDITHPSLYVRLPLIDREREFLVVWTTTPWTLPANVAAAVSADAQYARIETSGGGRLRRRRAARAGTGARQAAGHGGRLRTGRPRLQRAVRRAARRRRRRAPGCRLGRGVHGGGHRHRPYRPGLRRGGLRAGAAGGPGDAGAGRRGGRVHDGYGWLHAKHTAEAAPLVIEDLGQRGRLVEAGELTHRYPVCWRCGTELIYRLVDEWFIRCDEVRQPMIDAARKVEWTPPQYGKRMEDWLRNMGDWCISRKRYWGLPLPFYFCDDGHMTVVSRHRTTCWSAPSPAPRI